MKKLFPLVIITTLVGLIILALPGCDELVTNDNYFYDTLRIDGTIHEADTTCGICHNDETDSITIASRQWNFSGHSTGNLTNFSYLGQKTSVCGPQCHTKEGYVQFLADTSISTVYFPTEIGCFACHSPHDNKDFSLRDETDLCIQCHQQTIEPPAPGLTDIAISQNWGPHFSTETGMVLGIGGYEYNLFSYNTSLHSGLGNNSCMTCHMDTADVFTLGGHSLNLTYNFEKLTAACNTPNCHVNNPYFDYSAQLIALTDSLAALKDSLVAAGLLSVFDIPIAQSNITSDSAGALFNYLFVNGDSSSGAHNLPYAQDLVNSSLSFMSDRLTLTLVNAVTDSGTVTLDPVGGSYVRGTTITISVEVNTNYVFDSWSGDLTGSTNPTTVFMDSDKTITANYTVAK